MAQGASARVWAGRLTHEAARGGGPSARATTRTDSHAFQVRAHIYQARDLPAEDKSGLSDPFLRIAFSSASGETVIIPETLTPTWDETVVRPACPASPARAVAVERTPHPSHAGVAGLRTPPQRAGADGRTCQVLDNIILYGDSPDPRTLIEELRTPLLIEAFDYDTIGARRRAPGAHGVRC